MFQRRIFKGNNSISKVTRDFPPQHCWLLLTLTWDWWLLGSDETELVLYIWMAGLGPAALLIVTMADVTVVVVVVFSPARELSGLKYYSAAVTRRGWRNFNQIWWFGLTELSWFMFWKQIYCWWKKQFCGWLIPSSEKWEVIVMKLDQTLNKSKIRLVKDI